MFHVFTLEEFKEVAAAEGRPKLQGTVVQIPAVLKPVNKAMAAVMKQCEAQGIPYSLNPRMEPADKYGKASVYALSSRPQERSIAVGNLVTNQPK